MRRPAPPLAAVSAFVAAMAAAQAARAQWSVDGFFLQTITGLAESGDDSERDDKSLRSTTELGLSFARSDRSTQISLSPGVRLLARTDAIGGEEDFYLAPQFEGSLRHAAPRLLTGASLSVVSEFLSNRLTSDLFVTDPDSGEVSRGTRAVDPLEIRVVGRADATLLLDPRNRLTVDGFARAREYDETTDALQPNQILRGGLTWERDLTRRATGELSGSVSHFMTDRSDLDDSTEYTLTGGLRSRFTPRHDGGFFSGVSFVDGDDVGFTGGLDFRYRGADTTYRFDLRQTTEQDVDGVLQTVSRAAISAAYRVNSVSGVVAVASIRSGSDVFSGGGDDDLSYGVSLTYDHRITQDWGIGLSYRLQVLPDEDQVDNSVILSLSRRFSIIP